VTELVKSSDNMLAHFSQLAASYRYLRTTDLLPIMFMKGVLDGTEGLQAADIGCGAGRYCLKFLKPAIVLRIRMLSLFTARSLRSLETRRAQS